MKRVNGVRGHTPRELDQFFTRPDVATKCVNLLSKERLCTFDTIVEPSFGNGAFIDALDHDGDDARIVYMDIDACDENHRANFLEFQNFPQGTVLTIGNPPFGKAASLAIQFFNHAAKFSTCIAFIVPRTFSKISVQNRLDERFILESETVLESDSFSFTGKPYDVSCVFQIWVKSNSNSRPKTKKLSETDDFKFVKRTESPDLAIRRVGVNAGMIFQDSIPDRSESSHFFLQIKDKKRKTELMDILHTLDLPNAEIKFQTAGNPSISKNELCSLYMQQQQQNKNQ